MMMRRNQNLTPKTNLTNDDCRLVRQAIDELASLLGKDPAPGHRPSRGHLLCAVDDCEYLIELLATAPSYAIFLERHGAPQVARAWRDILSLKIAAYHGHEHYCAVRRLQVEIEGLLFEAHSDTITSWIDDVSGRDMQRTHLAAKNLVAVFRIRDTLPRFAAQPPVQLRPCLQCESPFLSRGAGNRVCNRCKQPVAAA